jgi:hypothetical protein
MTSRSSNTNYSSRPKNNNPRNPFNLKLASPSERYTNITASTGDQNPEQEVVFMRFPLSVLLKYSARAKKEIGEQWCVGSTGPRHIDWNIDIPKENVHNSLESRGLTAVLKWIYDTQPAHGYPKTFLGHPQFPGARMPIGLNARFYVYKALFILGLEAPLDHKNYLQNAIRVQLGDVNSPISPDTLALVYDLLHDDDMGLFTFALARHVEFYEGVDYASKEYKEFNELYENAPEDIQGLWDGLTEKLQRRKERDEKKAAYEEREARRQARSQL